MFFKINGCSDVDIEGISIWLDENNKSDNGVMNDNEIFAPCTSTQEEGSKRELDGKINGVQPEMTHSNAMPQLDNILDYLERQFNNTSPELL